MIARTLRIELPEPAKENSKPKEIAPEKAVSASGMSPQAAAANEFFRQPPKKTPGRYPHANGVLIVHADGREYVEVGVNQTPERFGEVVYASRANGGGVVFVEGRHSKPANSGTADKSILVRWANFRIRG